MSMGEYMALKDAEDSNGRVDWDQVPIRYHGNLDTGHPEDVRDDTEERQARA